jgi:hypothetical protein
VELLQQRVCWKKRSSNSLMHANKTHIRVQVETCAAVTQEALKWTHEQLSDAALVHAQCYVPAPSVQHLPSSATANYLKPTLYQPSVQGGEVAGTSASTEAASTSTVAPAFLSRAAPPDPSSLSDISQHSRIIASPRYLLNPESPTTPRCSSQGLVITWSGCFSISKFCFLILHNYA